MQYRWKICRVSEGTETSNEDVHFNALYEYKLLPAIKRKQIFKISDLKPNKSDRGKDE